MRKIIEAVLESGNVGNVKDLKNIDVRTNKGKLVHNIKDYIKEHGVLEYKGKKYTPVGRTYVGDEYVDNLKLRHEEIPQTVYVDAFCHTDKVVEDSEDELEVPRYKLTITDGVVVNVKKYDYDTIIFNKELD